MLLCSSSSTQKKGPFPPFPFHQSGKICHYISSSARKERSIKEEESSKEKGSAIAKIEIFAEKEETTFASLFLLLMKGNLLSLALLYYKGKIYH